MNKKLLKSSIVVLSELRSELQNSLETNNLSKLDEVISNLEIILQTKDAINADEILELFGKALANIPAVIEIIEFLSRKEK